MSSDDNSASFPFFSFFLDHVPSVGRCLQFLYCGCVVAAFAGMIYQCATLVNEMRAEPITTYIDTHNPVREFPAVSLCPTHLKYTLAKLLAVTAKNRTNSGIYDLEEVMTTLYVSNRVMQFFTSHESMSYFKAWLAQSKYTQEEWLVFKEHMWDTIIGPNRTYEETEMELTQEFADVVQEVPGYPLINKRKFMSVLGACYTFDFNLSIPLLTGRLARAEFSVPRILTSARQDYRSENAFFIDNSDRIILGEPSFWSQNPELAVYQTQREVKDTTNDPAVYSFRDLLGYNTMHTLTDYRISYYVTSITFNRLNLRRRPCRAWSEQDRRICMVQCFNDEFCSKMTDPCLIFHPNQTREEQYKQLCSWMEGPVYLLEGNTKHCLSRPEVWNGGPYDSLCSQRCPVRCFEKVNYFTREIVWANRILESNAGNADRMMEKRIFWANVTLLLQDSQRQMKLSEHHVWSTDTLGAALASAGSLWTGLSGLAVTTIIMSASAELCRRRRGAE